MRTVELEELKQASLFGRSVNLVTREMTTDAHWAKLEGFKAEQEDGGQWVLTAYIRRTNQAEVESGFQDLEALLDRVAIIRGVDSKHIRVVKP